MVQSDGLLLIKNKTKQQQKLPRRGKTSQVTYGTRRCAETLLGNAISDIQL